MSPKSAFTYRDYGALPNDGRRYEIHDGELCVTPAPSLEHQIILSNLVRALERALYARYGAPYLWLIPPDARVVEAFALDDNRDVVAATAAGADPSTCRPSSASHSSPTPSGPRPPGAPAAGQRPTSSTCTASTRPR